MKPYQLLSALTILNIYAKAEQESEHKSNKQCYEQLKKDIASVQKSCGEVCDLTKEGQPGKYFNVVEKNFDCPALFSNPDIDKPLEFREPPMRIPKWLWQYYTFHGKVEIDYDYRNDFKRNSTDLLYNFTNEVIELFDKNMDLGFFAGPYGSKVVEQLDHFIGNHLDVKDKQVLVIGSESPWIELMALRHGAKHCYTLEYSPISSEDSRITTMLPQDFNRLYLSNELPQFDVVISYSSVEHSGLGR